MPGATEETGGRWLMKLCHNPSNSNSMFPLFGSDPIDECAEVLCRGPTRDTGGIWTCGGVIPLTLASSAALDAWVDKMSWSGSFGIDGGVSKPGSGPLTACEELRPCAFEATPEFKWSEAGPERVAWV